MTHANGAQVGRVLPAVSPNCSRFGRCWSGTSVLRGVEMFVCVCLEWNALLREESAQPPTRLSPSTDKFSRRRRQPAAPPALRSLSPRFLFPDDRRQIILPAAYPGRDATSQPDQPTGVSRRSSEELHAPQTLQLIALSLLRHAGASDHPGRRC